MLAILLCSAAMASAQETRPAPGAFPDLRNDEPVRVLAPPSSVREGSVAGVDTGSSVLRVRFDSESVNAADIEQFVSFSSVEALWTQSRRTWLGAGIGGGAGAILGVLAAAVGEGLCEYDCDSGAGTYFAAGLLGAGAGALLGGLVGSAFSRWDLQLEQQADGRGWQPGAEVYRRPDAPDADEGAAKESSSLRGRTGWLVGQGGASLSSRSESTQVGLLLGGAIVADFGALRIGPELLLGGIGASQGVVVYGGVVQVPLGRGRFEPYIVAGAGGQSWNSTGPDFDQVDASLFALNGGVGLRLPAGSRSAVGVELRVHHSVQNYDGSTPWLFTLAATFGLGL
ncbi:MAG: hypothetical protein M8867_09270 [marine benthic group bacterium]|nr:hypothetical protein [Gemmatimonadota bacterium]